MPAVPTWLWLTAGWLAIAAAAWLILTGRFLPVRSRNKHCPRCRYDMSAAPTLTCPECGRTARSSKSLTRRTVLKRWRALGLLVLPAGVYLIHVPTILALGWPAALPNWALVLVAPADDVTRAWPASYNPATAPPPTARERLSAEIWSRLGSGKLDGWLAERFLRNAYRTGRTSSLAAAPYPRAWPWDIEWRGTAGAYLSPINQSAWISFVPPSGPSTSATLKVTMAAHGHEYVVDTLTVPVDMSRGRADFLEHVSTAEVNRDVAAALDPRLVVDKDKISLTVARCSDTPEWARLKVWLCYSVRVSVGDELVAEGWGSAGDVVPTPTRFTIPLKWKTGGRQLAAAHPGKLSATFIGEPGGSTERYLQFTPLPATIQPSKAWAGNITINATQAASLNTHPTNTPRVNSP